MYFNATKSIIILAFVNALVSLAVAPANGNVEIQRGYNKGVGEKPADYKEHPMDSYLGKYDKKHDHDKGKHYKDDKHGR